MNEDQDDMAMAEPLAGEELERMLARYGRVRLDPSQAQRRRARSVVMEAAWRQRIEANRVGPSTVARRLPFTGWGARRLGVSLSAAVVAGLMLGTSVFAGSRAGGPLYESRLAIEELGYPADADGRADAHLQAAQVRLAEAVEAAGRHDDGATVAALGAYDRSLAELEGASGRAADRALLAIHFHHEVLEKIARTVPAAAAAGVDRALANSERLMDRLSEADTDPGTSAGGGPGRGQGNQPGGVNPGDVNPGRPGAGVWPGGGGPSAEPAATATPKPGTGKPTENPDATPRPTRTPRPTATPKPVATGEPDATATPRPERTPRPHPSRGGGPGAGDRSTNPQQGQP